MKPISGVGGEGLDRQVSHSGSQEKTRTLMVVFPNQGSALTLMTNSEYADLRVVAGAPPPARYLSSSSAGASGGTALRIRA